MEGAIVEICIEILYFDWPIEERSKIMPNVRIFLLIVLYVGAMGAANADDAKALDFLKKAKSSYTNLVTLCGIEYDNAFMMERIARGAASNNPKVLGEIKECRQALVNATNLIKDELKAALGSDAPKVEMVRNWYMLQQQQMDKMPAGGTDNAQRAAAAMVSDYEHLAAALAF